MKFKVNGTLLFLFPAQQIYLRDIWIEHDKLVNYLYFPKINPSTPDVHLKVIHTHINLQLSAAGLFVYQLFFSLV